MAYTGIPLQHLFIIYLVQVLLVTLPGYGIALLLKKAGQTNPNVGYIPFVNTWHMQKLTGRKLHWVFWQFIPIVGWFITPGIFIEFVKLFGRYSFASHIAASLAAPIYLPIIGKDDKVRYIGANMVKMHRKSGLREWLDAAIFAIVAATLIRLFVFEAYVIPTGSMEKTLLVNDYLFVSKMTYGTRLPNTPLAIPFVHHTLPIINTKSYISAVKLPYVRWFARYPMANDVVVFNFPAGDTFTTEWDSKKVIYDMYRKEGRQSVQDNYTISTRPVDKRENYVKRCVAVAGDTIQVINGVLYVNNTKSTLLPYSQLFYKVQFKAAIPSDEVLKSEYGVDVEKADENIEFFNDRQTNQPVLLLTNLNLVKLQQSGLAISIIPYPFPTDGVEELFPHSITTPWTVNDYGKLWIPKKGVTITLNTDNVIRYRRAIESYEGNTFEPQANGTVLINGVATNTYTFKLNYYWMMGDNRHNSQDSRFWGYVPEDHLVGSPKLIWMSWEKGPRWKRLFSLIK